MYYSQVRQFTLESQGGICPEKTRPEALSKNEVIFLVEMVLSEMNELLQTVMPFEESLQTMATLATERKDCKPQTPAESLRPDAIAADQADALVDAIYYMCDAAAKKSLDLDKVFAAVHAANLAKRDPVSGTFLRRATDNKIVKPPGWTAPDVEKALFSL